MRRYYTRACNFYYGNESKLLVNKKKSIRADFVGLSVPNKYVYGFGLDFKGCGRNLPNLYSFNEK